MKSFKTGLNVACDGVNRGGDAKPVTRSIGYVVPRTFAGSIGRVLFFEREEFAMAPRGTLPPHLISGPPPAVP